MGGCGCLWCVCVWWFSGWVRGVGGEVLIDLGKADDEDDDDEDEEERRR